jgi:hypothetical protein
MISGTVRSLTPMSTATVVTTVGIAYAAASFASVTTPRSISARLEEVMVAY